MFVLACNVVRNFDTFLGIFFTVRPLWMSAFWAYQIVTVTYWFNVTDDGIQYSRIQGGLRGPCPRPPNLAPNRFQVNTFQCNIWFVYAVFLIQILEFIHNTPGAFRMQENLSATGTPPRTPLGSLQRSPRSSNWLVGWGLAPPPPRTPLPLSGMHYVCINCVNVCATCGYIHATSLGGQGHVGFTTAQWAKRIPEICITVTLFKVLSRSHFILALV